jgi:hypothetical protein
MKNYLIVLVPLMLLASSCEKFLKKEPLDTLTPDQAFATETNLQMYVNSFYQNMVPTANQIYGEGAPIEVTYFIGDNFTDITTVPTVPGYLVNGGYTSRLERDWTWTELRNINYFLANYKNANIADARKKHYAGIARFFRAWFYFNKVKRYGDVPFYNKPLTSTDDGLYKARDSRTVVMDSVLADINYAVANIDPNKDNSSTTITKWVALALKSRIALFEGTFRKYHTNLNLTASANTWLQEAVNSSTELVTSGRYSIYSTNKPTLDYRSLFITEAPKSSEIILAAAYSDALQKWHGATGYFSDFGKYQACLVKRFVNTYLNADGSRFTDNSAYNTVEFQNEVKNRDLRLSQTIRTPSYRRSNGAVAPPALSSAISGYQLLKFSLDDPFYDLNNRASNAIPVFRYAEVLLNLAEAKAELGTFTQGDWDGTIALLRKRAGIINTSMPTTLDTYMRDNFYDDVTSIPIMEIRRERAIELIAEAFRMDDLKRWKKGKLMEKEYDGIYVPGKGQLLDLNEDGKPDVAFVDTRPAVPVAGVYYYITDNVATKLSEGSKGRLLVSANLIKVFQDYKYLAPIPYNELLTNKNLVQNPGWDKP